MPQQSAAPPKGKVDLFDAMHAAATQGKGVADPYLFLYTLGRDARAGKYDIGFNEEAMRQKYAEDPAYKGHPDKLDEDVKTAKVLMDQVPGMNSYAWQYRPPSNYTESLGIYPMSGLSEASPRIDPWTTTNARGERQFTDTPERLAEDRGQYMDRFGAMQRTTPEAQDELASRFRAGSGGLYMDYELSTDQNGNVIQAPRFTESKYGELAYGKKFVSKWGAQTDERNWVMAGLTGMYNGLMQTSAYLVAPLSSAMTNTSMERVRTLSEIYQAYGGVPNKSSTWTAAANSGLLAPQAKDLQDASKVHAMADEKMFELIDQLKGNEASLREAARKGDEHARTGVDLLDLYEGVQGHGMIDKYFSTVKMLTDQSSFTPSARAAQQGWQGMEGIVNMVGENVPMLLGQTAMARGMAGLLAKTGSRAFISEAVAAGMRPTLTKMGQWTAGTVSSFYPAITQAGSIYQSARDVGYTADEAGQLASWSLPAIMASELALSTPWMLKSYVGAGGREGLEAMLRQQLGKEIPKDMSLGGKMSQLWLKQLEWLKKGSNNWGGNMLKGAAEAAAHEGPQEAIEDLWYYLMQRKLEADTGKHLFTRNDPQSMDLGQRALANFMGGALVGGIVGGVTNPKAEGPQPYDETIAAAVADGKATEVLRLAQDMQSKGGITPEEFGVIQQDVALSQDIMRGMNVSDPHYLQYMQGHRDLSRQYAESLMGANAREKEAAALDEKITAGGTDAGALQSQKDKLIAEAQSLRAHAASIVDGTEAVKRLKEDHLAVSSLRGDPRAAALLGNVDLIDQETQRAKQWMEQERTRAQELGQTRKGLVGQLNAQLDALVGSDAKGLDEPLQQVAALQEQLGQQGALTREDVHRTRSLLRAKRADLIGQLLKTEVEPVEEAPEPPDGQEPATPITFGHQLAALQEQGVTDENDFLHNMRGPQLAKGDYGTDAQGTYQGIRAVERADRSLGETDEQHQRLLDQLPRERQFEHRSNSDLLQDYLTSVERVDGGRAPAEALIAHFQGRTTATGEEVAQVKLAADALRGNLTLQQLFAGPLNGLDQRVNGTELERLAKTNQLQGVPKAFQQLHADAATVYTPAAALTDAQVQELRDQVSALDREHARLSQLVDVRQQRLDRFQRADRGIRTALLKGFAAAHLGMDKGDELTRMIAVLDQESDPARQEALLVRAEAWISERVRKDHKLGTEFLKRYFSRFNWEGREQNFTYLNAGWSKQVPLEQWHTPKMFIDPEGTGNNTALGAIVHTTTNWMAQLMRTDQGALYRAYSETMQQVPSGKLVPHAEQQQALLQVIAFLNNPDQQLTDELVLLTNVNKEVADRYHSTVVPRAMLYTGAQGTGKTSTISYAIDSVQRLKGRALNVAVLAPGVRNTINVSGAIHSLANHGQVHHLPLAQLDQLGRYADLDLVVIDEAHAMDEQDALKLREVMAQLPQAAALLLGDHNQVPSLSSTDDLLPVERRMMRTTPLSISFRHTNLSLLSALEELEPQVFANVRAERMLPTVPLSQYLKDHSKGVAWENRTLEHVVDAFAEHLGDAARMRDVFLITLDGPARRDALERLSKDARVVRAMDRAALEGKVLTMDKGDHSVLGLETEAVYVAIDPERLKEQFTRFLYTAAGRARQSVTAFLPNGRSQEVTTIPEVAPDGNANQALWSSTRQRLQNVVRDLAPAPVTPEKPVPSKPNHQVGDQVRLKEQTIVDNEALADLKGQVGTVVKMDLNRTKVAFPDGRSLSFAPDTLALSADKVPPAPTVDSNGPSEFTPLPAGDRTLSVTDERRFTPSAANAEEGSRIVRAHTPQQRRLAVFTGTLGFDAQQAQFSLDNPAFALRLKVLSGLSRTPNSYSTQLVYRANGSYYDREGDNYRGPAIEVHLSEDAEALINQGRRALKLTALTYAQQRQQGLTFLGTVPRTDLQPESSLHGELTRLWQAAEATTSGEAIEGFGSIGFAQQQDRFTAGKRVAGPGVSFDQLKQSLERKGALISAPMFSPKAWSKTTPSGERQWMSGVYIEVRAYNGAPPTRVLLHTLNADGPVFTQMGNELDQLFASYGHDRKLDRDLAEQTEAYHFLQWNRARLVKDGQFTVKGLKDLLTIRQGYPAFNREGRYGDRIKTLASALKAVQADTQVGPTLTQVASKAMSGTQEGFNAIDPKDHEKLMADTADVHMPLLYLDLGTTAQLPGVHPSAMASADIPVVRRKLKAVQAEPAVQRRSVEQVREYFGRVFGNRFLQSQLEFKPRVTDEQGRSLWGAMTAGYITLEEQGGTVRAGVERHEAVHRVLDLLLDPESRESVLAEARVRVAREKDIRLDQVTEEQAHEYVAEQYEHPNYDTENVLGRFVRWLKGVMRRWGAYRDRVADLLDLIDQGAFRDSEPLTNTDTPRFSRKSEEEDLVDDRSIGGLLPPDRVNGLLRLRDQLDGPVQPYVYRGGYNAFNLLRNVYGSDAAARSLVHGVAYQLTRSGPYAVPLEVALNDPLPTLKQAVTQLHAAFKAKASTIDPFVERDGGDRVHFDTLTPTEIDQLDDADWQRYVDATKGDDSVFKALVETVFPKVNVDRFLDGQYQEDQGELTTDVDSLDGLSAMVHDTNDGLDPFDRQSGLSRLMLDHLLFITPTKDGQDAERYDGAWTDPVNLRKVVLKAAQGALFDKGYTDFYEALGDKLLAVHKADPQSVEGKHAYTFYKKFMDPAGHYYTAEGFRARSYRYLQDNADLMLIKRHGQPSALRSVQGRIELATRVLNNVARMFTEVATSNQWMAEYTEGTPFTDPVTGDMVFPQGRLKARLFRFDGSEEEKNNIHRRTDAMFVPVGDNGLGIDPAVRERFTVGAPGDPRTPLFTIDAAGVRDAAGDRILDATSSGYRLTTAEPEVLEGFFRAAGYPVSIGTLQSLTQGGLDNERTRSGLLARLMGGWAMAIHAGFHRVSTGQLDRSLFSWQRLQAENTRYGGVNANTSEEITSGSRLLEERTDDPVPSISMLFDLNRQLGAAESRSRGTDYARSVYNASGNKQYVDTLGSAIRRLFPVLDGDTHASWGVEQHAEDLLQRDPSLRKGDRWLNPLLDPARPERIRQVYYGLGLRDTNGRGAADPRSASDLDTEAANLNLFFDGVLDDQVAEQLYVPGHTYGDRNAPPSFLLQQPGGAGKRVITLRSNGKSKSVEVNHALLDKWVAERSIQVEHARTLSLQRWATALETTPDQVEAQLTARATDPSFVQAVMAHPELVNNRDYLVKGGQLVAGRALQPTSTVYTAANNARIRQAAGQGADALRNTVNSLFRPHIDAYVQSLDHMGWKFADRVKREINEADRPALLEAYTYLHHVVDNWTSPLVLGDADRYKDMADWTKRSVMAFSPGHLGHFTATPRMAVVLDPEPEPWMGQEGAAPLDGQGYLLPWGYRLAKEAFGGNEGVVRPTMNKRAYVSSDRIVKYAEALVSPTVYRLNPMVQELVHRSLAGTPSLLQAWTASIGSGSRAEFDAATDAVLQQAEQEDVMDQLIHVVTSHKNVKMGLSALNRFGQDLPLSSFPVDPRFWVLQTNMERSLTDLRAPYHTQIASLMGLAPHNRQRIAELNHLESELARLYLEKVREQIRSQPGEDERAKVGSWLKQAGLEAAAGRGETGRFVEALLDADTSVNDPLVRQRLLTLSANRFNRNGINPKMHGQMFNQVSAWGMTVPDATASTQSPSTHEGIEQQTEEVPAQPATGGVGEIPQADPTQPAGLQQRAMRSLRAPSVENGTYMPGECMLPFVYAQEFGVTDPDMPLEAMKQDILTRLGEHSLQAFEKTLNVYVGRTPSSGVSGGQVMQVVGFVNDTGNTIYVPANLNKLTGADQDGDQLTVYFQHVIMADKKFPRIAGDIGTVEGLQNKVLDNFLSYYADPKNAELIMLPTGTERIETAMNELAAARPDLYGTDPLANEPAMPYSTLKARRTVFDGSQLIGQVAQMIKGYAFLSQAYESALGNDLDEAIFKTWVPPMKAADDAYVIDNLSQLLNGALDNVKLMVLGKAGINPVNAPLVVGALLDGKGLQEALLLAKDPVVMEATGRMQRDQSVVKNGPVSGNQRLYEYLPEGAEQLRRYAYLAEAVARATEVFNLNVRGLPTAEEDAMAYQHRTETGMNATWEQVATGQVGAPDFFVQTNPRQRDKAKYLQNESSIRSILDVRGAVGQLENMTAFLRGAEETVHQWDAATLLRHPFLQEVREKALGMSGRNGYFPAEQEVAYRQHLNDFLTALYANQAFSGLQLQMSSDLPAIDPSSGGGMFRYAMEFPRWFMDRIDAVRRLPDSDPRVQAARDNRFLQEVRLVQGRYPSLELTDGRRYFDPMAEELLTRDLNKLDQVLTGADLLGENPWSAAEALAAYVLLKERGRTSRNSIGRFTPPNWTKGYGLFLEELHSKLSSGPDTLIFDTGTGGQRSFRDLLEGDFLGALPGVAPDLLPKATVKRPSPTATHFRSMRKEGVRTVWDVRSAADPKTVLKPLRPGLTPPIAAGETNLTSNRQVLTELDAVTYRKLLSGAAQVTWVADRAAGWNVGDAVLPTGDVVRVSAIGADGRTLTLDATGIAPDRPGLDAHEPGVLYSTDTVSAVRDTARVRYHGANNVLINGPLTNALQRVARNSDRSGYRVLAERLVAAQGVAERTSTVEVGDLPAGHAGFITGDGGHIRINRNASALRADAALLHEALHRFTMHALSLSVDQLTPQERTYRSQVEQLYLAANRAGLPVDTYALSDVNEFVTACFTDRAFQQELQQVSTDGKTSLFHRFINWVGRLLGLRNLQRPLTNDIVGRVVDMTYDLIDYQGKAGRTFDDTEIPQDRLYLKDEPETHGVHVEQSAITDIRDLAPHLLGNPDAQRGLQQEREDRLIAHLLRNRIKWNADEQRIGPLIFHIGSMNKEQVASYLRQHAIPLLRAEEGRTRLQLVDALNSGKADFWKVLFPSRVEGEDMPQVARLFMDQLGHTDQSAYITWNDLRDPSRPLVRNGEVLGTVGDLKINAVKAFDGYNPIVKVDHTSKGLELTLLDISPVPLERKGQPGTGRHILSNFIPLTVVNQAHQLFTLNNEGGLRKVLLTLQAMALKQANPDVSFRRLKVASMPGGLYGRFSHDAVWLHDALREVKMMRRTPALFGQLPEAIKAVLNDEKLYEAADYKQSVMHQYMDWLYRGDIADPNSDAGLEHMRFRSELERAGSSPEGTDEGWRMALANRQRKLLQTRSMDELNHDVEYQFIAGSLRELAEKDRRGANSVRDTSKLGMLLKNASNVESDAIQWAQRTTQNSVSLIAKNVLDFRKQHDKWIDELSTAWWNKLPERNVGRLVDNGWKRFERLWRYSATEGDGLQVKDRNGKVVRARLNTLHWDASEPETRRLLENGELTHTELEYSNKVLDHVHQQLVRATVHRYRMELAYLDQHGQFQTKEATEAAEAFVQRQWKRGWVPSVRRRTSESIYQGKLKDTYSNLFTSLTNADAIFEEDQTREVSTSMTMIQNKYLAELTELEPSDLGSAVRLGRLGLSEDGLGNYTLDDPLKNDNLTQNLEAILNYFTLAVERMVVHEERTLPVINSARTLLHALETTQSTKQANNLKYLEDYTRRMVFNANAPNDGLHPFGIDPSPIANGLIALTTYGGVALNAQVALASGLYNTFSSWTTGLANAAADNGLFGTKEWGRALALTAKPAEAKKMRALMQYHFVSEMQEHDAANNERLSKTHKLLFSSHTMNLMNWWTDYTMRGAVMAAQMIKDGSWDAYSLDADGEVKYDPYKDRRIYQADGSKTKDGDALVTYLKKKLIEQGVVGQTKDGPLKAGYDLEMGRTFKWLSDSYVIGGVDASQRTMMDSTYWGRLIMQFRKFLPNKIYQWQGRRIASEDGGRLIFSDHPETGERIATWEKREIESYMGALVHTYKAVRDAQSWSIKEMTGKLDEADRFALTRMATDLALMAMLFALYLGFKDTGAEERKKKHRSLSSTLLYNNRVNMLFQNTGFDMISGSSLGLAYTFGDARSWAPALSSSYRMIRAVLGDPTQLSKFVPGKTTFDQVHEVTTGKRAK